METTAISLDAVINLINAWQSLKQDKNFIGELLSELYSFDISSPEPIAGNNFYHFYLGLDLFPNVSDIPEVYVIIIPEENDKKEIIQANRDSLETILTINKVQRKILGTELGESTRITEEEALRRIEAWDNIEEWVGYSEVFNVFDIPAEDMTKESETTLMTGYFAMKGSGEYYIPDIVIAHNTESDVAAVTTTYYDVARLCPPFKAQSDINAFGLLQFIYVPKSF